MVIFGCIARNAFGELTEAFYPEGWADWGRQICLSIILMRGGLELDFEGKGLTVVLLTLVPQFFEACTVAIFTHVFFGMPWSLCFAQGFCIGAVSPAVLVPSVMMLIERKFGVAKGIPQILLAASSFDDISAITMFSVFSTIAFDVLKADEKQYFVQIKTVDSNASTGNTRMLAEATEGGADVKTMIGMSVFYVITGFAVGCLLGQAMDCFNSDRCKGLS